MFDLTKFKIEHLEAMKGQYSYLQSWIDSGHAAKLEADKGSFTGTVNGKPAVCGGVNEFWADRAFIWAIFNLDFKCNFTPVFRGIRHFLKSYPCRRLEMAVPLDCPLGHKRAKLLGFEVECERARSYLPNGADCTLYALVRG